MPRLSKIRASRTSPRWLVAGLTIALSTSALGVAAQPAAANRSDAVTVTRYDLPAMPLSDALVRIAQQSGRSVSVDPALVSGLRAQPVQGTYSAEAAVRRAMQGSGLEVWVTSNGTLTARRAPPVAAAAELEPVRVLGTAETAFAHVDGYVAHRGSAGMKTDTALIETPQSISVVTSDQIRAVKASSVADALGYTPGFASQSPAFSRMVDDFMLRGFNVAAGNSGQLRDGLKLQSSVYDGGQEPYGLERVEVLRGAASVLYGQLGPGGVVNTISKRPTTEPLRELNVEAGSYGRRQYSGDFSGPLTEDGVWSYRLTGLVRDADNWMDHVPDDRTYLAPALTWRPSAATSLTFLASYQRIRTKFAAPLPASVTLNGALPRDLFIGEPNFDRYDTDSYTAGYVFEHAFNDRMKVRQSARYFTADGNWDYLSFGGLQANGQTLRRGVISRTEKSYGVAGDTSLEWKGDTGPLDHTVLVGADYYRSSYTSHRHSGSVAPLANIYAPVYGARPLVQTGADYGIATRSDAFGLYAQDQIKLQDRWVVVVGGRHDWADTKQKSYQTGADTTLQDSATTGRAGVVYLADNGLAPYVSASQSFSPTIGVDRSGNAFEPTKGTQYELGLRYEPPGSNMLYSAAIYDLTQRNALTADPADSTFSVQTGKVRSRGLELEAKLGSGPWNVTAAYAYTDARTIKANDPLLVDQRVSLVPLHSASLWVDRDMRSLGLTGLKLGAGVRYGSSTNLAGYAGNVSGQFLVDALASYDFGAVSPDMAGLSLTVNARNLFNRGFVTCSGATGCRYGDPRTLYATVSYRW